MASHIVGLDTVRTIDFPAMTEIARQATASDPVPSVLVSNQMTVADLAYHLTTDHFYPANPDWVIRHQDQVVAWIGFSKPMHWLKPGVHRLIGPFVSPEFQGRGLGKALLERAIRFAKEQGLKGVLEVVVPENRTRSISLLERVGFEKAARVFLLERPAGTAFQWSKGVASVASLKDLEIDEFRPVIDDEELADIIARGYAGAWEKYETSPEAIAVLRSDPRFDPWAVYLARQRGHAIALSRCDLDPEGAGPERRAHWWTIAVDPAHRGNLGLLLAMGKRMFEYLDGKGVTAVQTGYVEGKFFLGQAYRLVGFRDTHMQIRFYRLALEA